MKESEGWGQASSEASHWSYPLGFVLYCDRYYIFRINCLGTYFTAVSEDEHHVLTNFLGLSM